MPPPLVVLIAHVIENLFTRRNHVKLLAGKLLEILLVPGLLQRGGEGFIFVLLRLSLCGERFKFRLGLVDLLVQVEQMNADEQ